MNSVASTEKDPESGDSSSSTSLGRPLGKDSVSMIVTRMTLTGATRSWMLPRAATLNAAEKRQQGDAHDRERHGVDAPLSGAWHVL